MQSKINKSDVERMSVLVFSPQRFGKAIALLCGAIDKYREELWVMKNTGSGVDKNDFGASARSEIEPSSFAPMVLAAELYGGSSEYFPFWQLSLWSFSWIRMFAEEED